MRIRARLATVLAALASAASAATSPELALAPYNAPRAPDATAWPREKLVGFMREIADFVYANHVVTAPQRKTFGMVYEFWKDGRQIQEFGLDSMHDGAWWMSAMISAHRADPAGGWLDRVQKYQVPFYTNLLLNSDRLFPKMEPTTEDKNPWTAPVKGWAPRGWDDGGGFDRKTGLPLSDGYFTGSNHLAQDLADALLDVWLTTRDPQITAALQALRDAKASSFGAIQGLEIGAAFSAGRADAFLRYKLPDFTTEVMNPYFTGMFLQKGSRLPAYDDGLAWMYRQATAAAQVSGEFPRGFAAHAIARCYSYQAAMEMFFDQPAFEYGVWLFDLQRAPGFIEGTGALDNYASASRNYVGGRGLEISWTAAGMLPELNVQPELWDTTPPARFAGEPRVPITDAPPATDAKRDDVYKKLASPNGDDVWLLSDPRNLYVFVESSKPEVALTFQHAIPGSTDARMGKITIKKDGTVNAVNDRGAKLLNASAFADGERWSAEMRIPYSVVPGQGQWINGVDHGRYIVGFNGKLQTVYFNSSSARIMRRLENLTLGSIDYWHRVWRQKGIIPSALSGPGTKVGEWEISDAGNCAHLVKTIALWLIYTDGKREWTIIRDDFPKEPNPAPSLPPGVLKAQGIK